ncbi:MarR family transcriptional regulator [Streptomyces sp. SID14478]|uniref:MarR family winged helix-turn-helix transcriptional regulator n=1 Tax=Streptomyces sp. SID14478 TaxID=2706073 RepID=UPI0013DFFDBD|nr:MarR family transcriptional regulator [Streptomyces sp. SID14478]NEB81758.1 MarR family transcriptional regulator [Streptomyces sp. SID14478]
MHLPVEASGAVQARRIEGAARGLLRGIGLLTQALFKAGEFGLTRSQVALLDALEAGPLRVTGLATATGMAQPRVTVCLQKLEEAGLVERQRCAADRRAVETSLTSAGRDLLERGRRRMAAALLAALASGAESDGPVASVEESERAVATARDAIAVLLDAMESEAS